MRIGLAGRSYVHRSPNIAAERTVNLYPEPISGGGKTAMALVPTPGLATFCALPSGPVRALFHQNDRTFAVGGPTLYEVTAAGVATALGKVRTDGKPATITSNGEAGHQLAVASAGSLYVYDLNDGSFGKVLDGKLTSVGFIDGYFVGLDVPTATLRLSALENGLDWDDLDVAQRATAADKWLAMAVSHREIWLFGGQTMDVWYNAGADLFPFLPRPGADSDVGILAPASLVSSGNTVIWLGQNAEGKGTVYRAVAYQPVSISDGTPLAAELETYASVDDAIGWSYGSGDHTFYVLSFPAEGKTWVYDLKTGMWHERGWWNAPLMRYDAYRPASHCLAWGSHLVGDWATGVIYEMAPEYRLDADGAEVRRMRQTAHICQEQEWLFHETLQIDLESGLGQVQSPALPSRLLTQAAGFTGPTPTVPPLVDTPTVSLSWSDDGGHTWSQPRTEGAGKAGVFTARCLFRQLGRSRDRIYRIVLSDPIHWHLVDVYLTASLGAS